MVEIWQVVLLSGFAGFVNYLQRFAGDTPPPWRWGPFSVNTFTGMFVGLLAFLIARKHLEIEYVLVAIAIASYGGPRTLDAGWQIGRDMLAAWATRAARGVEPTEKK